MRLALAVCVWMLSAFSGAAQQAQPQANPSLTVPLPVLIIDSERVFLESEFGRRVAADLADMAATLQAENDAVAADLRAEERSLTERRPDMSPEDFRAAADAFDEKVQEVRAFRDAKNLEFQNRGIEARSAFEDRVQGILAAVMLERGAVMMIEQRNVLLSVRAANVTDLVIARIDEELGDGTQ